MGVLRDNNGSAPKLYIEFEDDADADPKEDGARSPSPPGEPGEGGLVGPRETIEWPPGGWPARSAAPGGLRLVVLPPRYRKFAAAAIVAAGLAATAGGNLAAQAAQREAARATVTVLDASYAPSEDGQTLNLLVDLTDPSAHAVTVTRLQASQSGLKLDYFGAPLSLVRTEQLEIVLSGAFDCAAGDLSRSGAPDADSHPGVLHLTVRNAQGNETTIDVPLPASAQLPGRFAGGRAANCAQLWGS
ncbi:hypothetical protein KGA66_06475 [Actinocrinis puniceicyclus]|uniref:Uncharacterized protein n=1 Tax=Actinocrinis puniceicyclus TaxID=977794 RepID=A0A8J7WI53_9ACTN|nr:hypothetical protein [Actinocrinis puniceicyclus]MBS2962683.1 hypothetical protein [Actinocrinis puniceicyclus]